MLEQEFKYYLEHQDELVKKYNGQYLVIHGNKVQQSFEKQMDAYQWGTRHFELGTFLLQLCTPGDAAYTATFRSRLTLA